MIYLIAIAAFAAMVGGAYFTGRGQGVDEQKGLDEPVIARLSAEKALLDGANKRFAADLSLVRGDVISCNTKVDALKADGQSAAAVQEQIIKESEQRKKDYARIMADYKAAITTSRTLAPDKQCAAATSVLMNLSENMRALDALGLPADATKPPPDTLKITPPKSAVKTLGIGK